MKLTKELIARIMDARPFKLSASEVNYRDADSDDKCAKCAHFYQRVTDERGVCELFRSDKTDAKGVDPEYVCDGFSPDNETAPLLEE